MKNTSVFSPAHWPTYHPIDKGNLINSCRTFLKERLICPELTRRTTDRQADTTNVTAAIFKVLRGRAPHTTRGALVIYEQRRPAHSKKLTARHHLSLCDAICKKPNFLSRNRPPRYQLFYLIWLPSPIYGLGIQQIPSQLMKRFI